MNKLLAPLLLVACLVHADDITTTTGKTYSNAVVSRIESDALTVKHGGGISRIPFTELGGDLQKRYGFDPAKAVLNSRDVATETRRQQKIAKIVQGRCSFYGHVESKTEGGLVINGLLGLGKPRREQVGGDFMVTLEKVTFSGRYFLAGYPNEAGLVDNDLVSGVCYPAGIYPYETVLGSQATIKRLAFTPELAESLLSSDKP